MQSILAVNTLAIAAFFWGAGYLYSNPKELLNFEFFYMNRSMSRLIDVALIWIVLSSLYALYTRLSRGLGPQAYIVQ